MSTETDGGPKPLSFQPEAENRTAHTFVVNSCMQTLVRDVNARRRITTAHVRRSQSSASQIRRANNQSNELQHHLQDD